MGNNQFFTNKLQMVEYLADKAAFEAAINETNINEKKPLVIDFTATWCPPCKMIGPIFEGMAKDYTDWTFKKVDVDANADAAGAAGTECMPTFKFYQNGEVVDTLEGAS